METLIAQLPNGRWIAVALVPGTYATGLTQAAAEAAVRRKLKARANPAPVDEDAIDREIIRKRRKTARFSSFDTLKREFLK